MIRNFLVVGRDDKGHIGPRIYGGTRHGYGAMKQRPPRNQTERLAGQAR